MENLLFRRSLFRWTQSSRPEAFLHKIFHRYDEKSRIWRESFAKSRSLREIWQKLGKASCSRSSKIRFSVPRKPRQHPERCARRPTQTWCCLSNCSAIQLDFRCKSISAAQRCANYRRVKQRGLLANLKRSLVSGGERELNSPINPIHVRCTRRKSAANFCSHWTRFQFVTVGERLVFVVSGGFWGQNDEGRNVEKYKISKKLEWGFGEENDDCRNVENFECEFWGQNVESRKFGKLKNPKSLSNYSDCRK